MLLNCKQLDRLMALTLMVVLALLLLNGVLVET
nr:MAG TPA_asm: hypothetical protein [Bacteriophage sp.]